MKYFSILLVLLFFVNANALQITTYPTVNFGNISYGTGMTSGKSTVTVSPSGTVSSAGSGGIMTQSGGSAGTIGFKATDILELLVNVKVAKTTSQTITTPGCGSITVSNLVLAGSLNLLTLTILLGVASTTVGATVAVSSTNSYNCTISGTIPGALTYSTLSGDTNPNTPLDLKISVFILPPPLTLTHKSGTALNFGTLCQSATAQTLTIAPNSTATGTNLKCAAQGYSADNFTVGGYNGATYAVNAISSIQLTNASDGTKLTVDQFTPSCSSNCSISEKSVILSIGGRLTVPPTATVGTYTGTYPVTITY